MPHLFLILLYILNLLIYSACGYLYPPLSNEDKLVKRGSTEGCDEEVLIIILAQIRVVNPESIFNIVVTEDWSPMCRKVLESIEKSDKYLSSCTQLKEPNLFVQLIKGVKTLYEKVCVSDFKKKFEMYHTCIKELGSEFEDCVGPADWNEHSLKNKICSVYKNITDCYYIKIAMVCGTNAAVNFKELMTDVIDHVITVRCSEVGYNPRVDAPMPEAYVADVLHSRSKSPKIKTSNFIYFLEFVAVISLYNAT